VGGSHLQGQMVETLDVSWLRVDMLKSRLSWVLASVFFVSVSDCFHLQFSRNGAHNCMEIVVWPTNPLILRCSFSYIFLISNYFVKNMHVF